MGVLKIRMAIQGAKKFKVFRVVVSDSENNRDSGNVIEILGNFDLRYKKEYNKKEVHMDFQRAKYWISKGAVVTPAVQRLFSQIGLMPPAPIILPRDWDSTLFDKSKMSIKKWYEARKKILGEDDDGNWPGIVAPVAENQNAV